MVPRLAGMPFSSKLLFKAFPPMGTFKCSLYKSTSGQVLVEPVADMGSGLKVSELPNQGTTVELPPLVLKQIEQIATGISSKLRGRLSEFWSDSQGQAWVHSSTKDAVNQLVTWLSSQSDTVTATVSNDGILSIATVFENKVRLYVEIERNGSTEAAVTRARRYAFDLSGNTLADLTPEVILAAVEGI